MKKSVLLFSFLIIAVFAFSQTSQEWQWIHPRPQGQNINWFKMIDANNWIAAGNYGTFIKTTNAGATWRTTTGGYRSTLYPGSAVYQNIRTGFFFNANTGFIGVQAVRGIAKTTNGGLTFDTLQILTSGSATTYGIYFLNSLTGYICGTSTLKAQKTTDGGQTWTMLPNLGTTTLYGIYAADTNNIIISSTSGNVYFTTNAGQNWTTSNTGTTATFYGLNFINYNTGYVYGSSGIVKYTTDAGLNWAGNNPTNGNLYNLVISGPEVYVSGTVSTQDIYKSTDNGWSWSAIPHIAPNQQSGTIYAYGFDKLGSTLVITGTYGGINKSINNGANWTSIKYSVSNANMQDIYAQNGNGRVIAIGYNSGNPDVIMYSSNGGMNWNTSGVTGSSQFMNDICMINPNTGYVCGRYGLFIKTTNGGVTWDSSNSNNPLLTGYFLNGCDFVNENTGWVVGGVPGIGGSTKIFKTTNGGANWTEQTSAFSGPVGVKIDMYDANTGFMTHAAGLQKTTNGGENWNLVTTIPTSGSFSPICVVDALNAFTGSSTSQVYGTSNGGASWDILNFPVAAGTIFDTHWYDANNGVAGGVIGVVGVTTNRGQSWQIYNTGGYTTYAVNMVHPDTIYAVSGNTYGAQIFKYTKGLVTGGFTYEHNIPSDYSLMQNYPNPFNPVTTIEFNLPKAGNVSVKVFDIAGREYFTEIRNLNLIPGSYKMNFNGSNLSSGIYFYSLVVDGNNIATNKMMLIK